MNRPTKSGWYWFRWNDHEPEAVLYTDSVHHEGGYFYRAGFDTREYLCDWLDPEIKMKWGKLEVPND